MQVISEMKRFGAAISKGFLPLKELLAANKALVKHNIA